MSTLTPEAISEACQQAQAPLDQARKWLDEITRLVESAVDMGWTPEHRAKAVRLVGDTNKRKRGGRR